VNDTLFAKKRKSGRNAKLRLLGGLMVLSPGRAPERKKKKGRRGRAVYSRHLRGLLGGRGRLVGIKWEKAGGDVKRGAPRGSTNCFNTGYAMEEVERL